MQQHTPGTKAVLIQRYRTLICHLSNWFRRNNRLLYALWDIFSIGVLGLNSFILLYHRYGQHNGMDYVICSGAAGYAIVFLVQAIWLRGKPRERHRTARQIKSAFRLIYTAFYLTAIMLDVIESASIKAPGYEQQLSFYGILFLGVGLWGTNCLWLGKAVSTVCKCWKEDRR